MKILWITNILLPGACKELGIQPPVVGGWMQASADALRGNSDIQLAVASVYPGKELQTFIRDGIIYYLLPEPKNNTRYNSSLETYWRRVQAEYKPDVVHIHGTEFGHGLAYIKACGSNHVVVSIQGLVSVIHRYYTAGITVAEQLKNITFRDIVRMGTIWQQKRKFRTRGLLEQAYIRSVSHIIGRTSWDKAHVLAINPAVHYHFCNETLRGEFYKHRWDPNTCENHTIFLSQATYPIKGLHQVIKALPNVVKQFPDTKIVIAGPNILDRSTWIKRMKQSGYAKYVSRLINKLGMGNCVQFTGSLNEQEICNQYLRANVFVCPSSIENSPNSLGEAQLLGVPCIASYVGGVPDMIPNEQCGQMYRFEEVEMLAEKICEVFGCTSWDNTAMQEIALKRHDLIDNRAVIMSIYKGIE